MSFQEIRYEVDDHVLTITLDRPDRLNAFTPTMQRELIEAFDRSDADDETARRLVYDKYRHDDDLEDWRNEALPVAIDLR